MFSSHPRRFVAMFLKTLIQTMINIWKKGDRRDVLFRPAHCRQPMIISRVDRSCENPTITFLCVRCNVKKQAFFSDVVAWCGLPHAVKWGNNSLYRFERFMTQTSALTKESKAEWFWKNEDKHCQLRKYFNLPIWLSGKSLREYVETKTWREINQALIT